MNCILNITIHTKNTEKEGGRASSFVLAGDRNSPLVLVVSSKKPPNITHLIFNAS